MPIFELLLSPESWKRPANVPALVRLLQAYLLKAPNELNREGRLSQVLGMFNRLVSVSSMDEQGFYVLNTVIENLGYDVIAPFMGHISAALFARLQNSRTEPLIELKLISVASTRLLCEYPALLDAAAASLWGKMLDSIVTLLSRPETDRIEEELEVPDIGEAVGYTATFVQLHNAGKKEEDPLKEIKDQKEFLMISLAKLSALYPGSLFITSDLDDEAVVYLEIASRYDGESLLGVDIQRIKKNPKAIAEAVSEDGATCGCGRDGAAALGLVLVAGRANGDVEEERLEEPLLVVVASVNEEEFRSPMRALVAEIEMEVRSQAANGEVDLQFISISLLGTCTMSYGIRSSRLQWVGL
ncbi:hypothetical protein HHK36_029179 [Tetracentron sinense]|uniref:Exportin-2 C-terminal domain-containing protein n=1 Tax=Tetracentron sinense TaxID=13715 RepID=A0A835D0W8_TETSI|nr:hypothetical protein HHK36_029179 [Tetracentron sinense]